MYRRDRLQVPYPSVYEDAKQLSRNHHVIFNCMFHWIKIILTSFTSTLSNYWQVIDIARIVRTIKSNFSIFNFLRLATVFSTTSLTPAILYFPPCPTICFWIFINISEFAPFARWHWKSKSNIQYTSRFARNILILILLYIFKQLKFYFESTLSEACAVPWPATLVLRSLTSELTSKMQTFGPVIFSNIWIHFFV